MTTFFSMFLAVVAAYLFLFFCGLAISYLFRDKRSQKEVIRDYEAKMAEFDKRMKQN